uniref:class I SAM-dependent methyltransferase n=1 Tax=Halpernia frigidisoli TaxID=1125876 RepID=UPI000B7E999E|nr:class I SAM-dependent methyltransferase [Halpernia frigidisoli]
MNPILKTQIQNFINANLKTDLHSLLLKKSPFPEVSMQEIVQQIKGRNVAAKKFPFLLKEGIIFPPNLNLEQSSSEATSKYKSQLFSGEKFLDLTSGFGIDAYFLSENFNEITLVEKNTELLKIVEHNWKILDKKATFKNENLENFLDKNYQNFDLIYLDPARRNLDKKKVFLLEDLSPNILEIQDELLNISSKILIKLSPLIDLSYLISVLKNLENIYIIAFKNEVKEIAVLLNSKKTLGKVKCICANLESDEPDFEFIFDEEKTLNSEFSDLLNYVYIPNNSVLKSGAFNSISQKFNLKKLHPNSHFYTSNDLTKNFPGRVLKVEKIDSKQIKKGDFYNIISKNYPLKPDEIKNKYKIKDGGENYLIFTQTMKSKIILRSTKN